MIQVFFSLLLNLLLPYFLKQGIKPCAIDSKHKVLIINNVQFCIIQIKHIFGKLYKTVHIIELAIHNYA